MGHPFKLQLTAEQQVQAKVLVIDAIRQIRLTYADRFIGEAEAVDLIAEVDAEIVELKKHTGPRRLVGAGQIGM